MRKVFAAAFLLGAICAWSAAAAPALTPAQYRSKVEQVCRINGIMMKGLDTKMSAARKAGDAQGYYGTVGSEIGLTLIQDRQLETTAIPLGLRPKMSAVMPDLHGLDRVLNNTVRIARTGNTTAMNAELAKAAPFIRRILRHLTAAGLPHCAAMYR